MKNFKQLLMTLLLLMAGVTSACAWSLETDWYNPFKIHFDSNTGILTIKGDGYLSSDFDENLYFGDYYDPELDDYVEAYLDPSQVKVLKFQGAVSGIEEGTFGGYTNLTDVYLYYYMKGFANAFNLGSLNNIYLSSDAVVAAFQADGNWSGFKGEYKLQNSSGDCGDNLTWSVDEISGTFTISGTGNMWDVGYYEDNPSAWYYLWPAVTKLSIGEGVTSIGACAFQHFTKLETVTISGNVKSIGEQAFSVCANLESVTIPGNVKSIGSHAFNECAKLESVTIEEGVTSIDDYAFAFCGALETVQLPTTLAHLNAVAFDLTPWWNSYKANADNRVDNVVYVNNIACQLYDRTATSCTFKAGTVGIAGGFLSYLEPFWGTYVTKEENFTLTSVTIPNTVKYIGKKAFYGARALTSVTFKPGSQLTTLERQAFNGNYELTSIEIPASVKAIEGSAFSACYKLETITIRASSLDVYGQGAFAQCGELKKIYVPNSSVDTYKAGWPAYASIIEGFEMPTSGNCGTPTATDVTWNYNATDKMLTISGTGAMGNFNDNNLPGWFDYYTDATSVVIGEGVTGIGSNAFRNFYGLTTVTVDAENATLGTGALDNCTSLETIFVPAGKVDAYKAAANWSAFADKIQPLITEIELTPDATGKQWTLAEMPDFDVELQVVYKTDMKVAVTYGGEAVTEDGISGYLQYEADFAGKLEAAVSELESATAVEDATVTYTSGDITVLAFKSGDGYVASGALADIAFLKEGSAELTVAYAGDADNAPASATVKVNVEKMKYSVEVSSDSPDNAKWEIVPDKAVEGTSVKATYKGYRKLKGVKAVEKKPSGVLSGLLVKGSTFAMKGMGLDAFEHECTFTYNGSTFTAEVIGTYSSSVSRRTATLEGNTLTIVLGDNLYCFTYVFDMITGTYTCTASGTNTLDITRPTSYWLNGVNITESLSEIK